MGLIVMKMCWFLGWNMTDLVRYSKHNVLRFVRNQRRTAFSSSMSLSFPPTDFVPVQARTHHQQTRNPAGADGRLRRELIIRPRRRNQESAWLAVEDFHRFRWHCISESLRAHHAIFRVIRTSCKQHISHKNNRLMSEWTLRLGFKTDAYNLSSTVCCYVRRVWDFYICIAACLMCMNQYFINWGKLSQGLFHWSHWHTVRRVKYALLFQS